MILYVQSLVATAAGLISDCIPSVRHTNNKCRDICWQLRAYSFIVCGYAIGWYGSWLVSTSHMTMCYTCSCSRLLSLSAITCRRAALGWYELNMLQYSRTASCSTASCSTGPRASSAPALTCTLRVRLHDSVPMPLHPEQDSVIHTAGSSGRRTGTQRVSYLYRSAGASVSSRAVVSVEEQIAGDDYVSVGMQADVARPWQRHQQQQLGAPLRLLPLGGDATPSGACSAACMRLCTCFCEPACTWRCACMRARVRAGEGS